MLYEKNRTEKRFAKEFGKILQNFQNGIQIISKPTLEILKKTELLNVDYTELVWIDTKGHERKSI